MVSALISSWLKANKRFDNTINLRFDMYLDFGVQFDKYLVQQEKQKLTFKLFLIEHLDFKLPYNV